MQHLGLTAADRRLFEATLRTSHDVRVDVDLLTLDRQVVSSAAPQFLDGQVLADRHGFGEPHGPQRRLTTTLLDPGFELDVDTRSPRAGTVYYDRLVQVHYGVYVDALDGGEMVPVFTGPPWKLQRTDAEVYIEADDASVLGWGEAWKPLKINKGTLKTEAAKRILRERCGFTRFRFPDRKTRLAHGVSIGRKGHGWAWAERILASMDLHLYVDGYGIPTARRLPMSPLWTFNPGNGGEIIEPLALTTSRERFANVVEVIGRKPKGSKRRVRWVEVADRKHPHSPWNLAANGVPYRKVLTIRNDHFRTEAECRRKAKRVLADRLRAHTELTCSILPWPHMTQGDMARFTTMAGGVTVDRVDAFTLGLGVEGAPATTLNWVDSAAPHRAKVRR